MRRVPMLATFPEAMSSRANTGIVAGAAVVETLLHVGAHRGGC